MASFCAMRLNISCSTHGSLLRAPEHCPLSILSASYRQYEPIGFQKKKTLSSCRGSKRARLTCSSAHSAIHGELGLSTGDPPLVYNGIVFDMDGTLSVSCIDYNKMRASIGIPVGDLFTVMETWDDGSRIQAAMETILEIESVAAAQSRGMPGLLELLKFLKLRGVRVGLVTRNTVESVDAFFAAIGPEWRELFDILLTRDNTPFVKPDKRCLLHFAYTWGVPPYKLLMVGDSSEDVECGNAAGTATCLISGGGNETSAAPSRPPPGAVPTFTVDSLLELKERLNLKNTGLGWGAYGTGTVTSDTESDSECPISQMLSSAAAPGAPPPGLEFLDWLFSFGVVEGAACSFPRIDGARFGRPPDEHPGSKVLHLQCGNGALTKLLFSAGLLVVGADPVPAASTRRGLIAMAVERLDRHGALTEAYNVAGGFDAVVLYGTGPESVAHEEGLESQLLASEALAEVARVLRPNGKLAVEVEMKQCREHVTDILIRVAGLRIVSWMPVAERLDGSARVRVVAIKSL